MKTVYVVTAYADWDDKVTIGVFSSMEQAQKAIETVKGYKFGHPYDGFEIEDFQMDEVL